MMKLIKKSIILGLLFISSIANAQDILPKEKAIEITLENNYNIKVVKNTVDIAKNNTSLYNSGYLPTVTANAGANYTNNNNNSEFKNGQSASINGLTSNSYNASIGLNYVIFDGFNRKNTFNKLKETYNITELQARQVIENSILTLFSAYYEVARLKENEQTQKEILEISKQRLKRANYSFDYGQNTKLDVLNAEVDRNNDSISYLNVKRLLTNSKRDLNVVLGRAVNTPVEADTEVDYILGLNLDDLIAKAEENNAELLQAKKNSELSEFDIKISKSGWMPNVALTGSYAWSKSINDGINDFSVIDGTQKGINAGLNLSWNIFDGGKTKTRVANSKIALDTQNIIIEQQTEQLKRDINNAWESYKNSLFTLEVQEKNVLTSKRNFERTNERYKLGQVNSIDFRQAQTNLINAQLSVSQAKYNAKNNELKLLQLAGILLDNKSF